MLIYDRLLITGAAGKLGRHLRTTLKPLCRSMVLCDIAQMEPAGENEECRTVDLADRDSTFGLMRDVNAVVHLAGIIVEAPFEEILQPNIVGSYHVWEGAHRAGVKRIVYASSCHAVGMYRRDERIDAHVPQRPDGFYGLSKAFSENLARMYFDRHGIEAACLRIGSCFPEPTDARMLATWLSRGDLTRLVTACLEAPYLGFAVVYGMSANGQTFWSNDEVDYIGYHPRDTAETYRNAIAASPGPIDREDPKVIFQAGAFAEGMTR